MVGIIGGTGLDHLDLKDEKMHYFARGRGAEAHLRIGTLPGTRKVAFVARHDGFPPHKIDHKANVRALLSYGVDRILSISAVGSLTRDIPPGSFVLPDDFIDLTGCTQTTINDTIRHPEAVNPYPRSLRRAVQLVFHAAHYECQALATVVSIRGPRFATRAESLMYANMGAHLINMTTGPETNIALELRVPHTLLCLVTDYDSCAHDPLTDEPTSYELVKSRFAQMNSVLTPLLPKIVNALESCTTND